MYKYKPLLTASVLRAMACETHANQNGEPVSHSAGRCIVAKSEVRHGDCVAVLRNMPDNHFHAVVTDPPYAKNGLSETEYRSMIGAWLSTGLTPLRKSKRKGIDGSEWDAEVPGPAVWKEALRTLKHGGYLAAFMSEEKVDLLTIALRLAGFEIVHVMPWIKGAGHETYAELGKQVQREIKRAGNDNTPDKIVGYRKIVNTNGDEKRKNSRLKGSKMKVVPIIEITVPGAICWKGAKQCLNHAHEFIVIARKPLSESSNAKNIVMHGTGGMAVGAMGINDKMASTIDACIHPEFPWGVKARRTTKKLSDRYMDEGQNNPHSCAKPLELIQWLTKLVCPDGGRVLDPFVGSGTGGIAALLEGYDFVGIEQDRHFADVALARIKNCEVTLRESA